MGKVTVRIGKETAAALDGEKLHPDEDPSSVVRRLMEKADYDDELSPETLRDIEEAMEDFKAGRTYTHEQAKKMMGLE